MMMNIFAVRLSVGTLKKNVCLKPKKGQFLKFHALPTIYLSILGVATKFQLTLQFLFALRFFSFSNPVDRLPLPGKYYQNVNFIFRFVCLFWGSRYTNVMLCQLSAHPYLGKPPIFELPSQMINSLGLPPEHKLVVCLFVCFLV